MGAAEADAGDSVNLGLQGKQIVVSGGTGFLGEAVVRVLREAGAEVWLPVFAPSELERVDFGPGPAVHLELGVDLSDELQAVQFFGKVPDLWGSVHCAGGFTMGPFLESSIGELQHMLQLNLHTCFLSCREAARAMVSTGRGGRIVNVSAQPGVDGRQGGYKVPYAASKAAVANLTQAAAAELVSEGILVNAVVPSIIDTPPNRAGMPEADHEAWATPEEIAHTIAFLVSPANRVTRGELVSVAGRS